MNSIIMKLNTAKNHHLYHIFRTEWSLQSKTMNTMLLLDSTHTHSLLSSPCHNKIFFRDTVWSHMGKNRELWQVGSSLRKSKCVTETPKQLKFSINWQNRPISFMLRCVSWCLIVITAMQGCSLQGQNSHSVTQTPCLYISIYISKRSFVLLCKWDHPTMDVWVSSFSLNCSATDQCPPGRGSVNACRDVRRTEPPCRVWKGWWWPHRMSLGVFLPLQYFGRVWEG